MGGPVGGNISKAQAPMSLLATITTTAAAECLQVRAGQRLHRDDDRVRHRVGVAKAAAEILECARTARR